jgi:hypothetical protein
MSFIKRSTRSLIASEAFMGGAVIARTLRQSRACKQAGPVWATGGVAYVRKEPDPDGHPRAPRRHVFGNVDRALGSGSAERTRQARGNKRPVECRCPAPPGTRSRHGGEGSGEGLPGIPGVAVSIERTPSMRLFTSAAVQRTWCFLPRRLAPRCGNPARRRHGHAFGAAVQLPSAAHT